jgi:hypothetical protein
MAIGIEAVELARRTVGPVAAASIEHLVAWAAVLTGGAEDAFAYAEVAIERLRALPEYPDILPGILHTAGEAARLSGLLSVAVARHLEVVDIGIERSLEVTCRMGLAGLAAVAAEQGEGELAARLLGAAGEDLTFGERTPDTIRFFASLADAIRAAAGWRYDELLAEGRRLSLVEARELAVTLVR